VGHTAAGRPGTVTETWVRSAFDLLSEVPGVRRVGLALVEGGGRSLAFTASDRDPSDHSEWCDVDAYEDVPLNNTVRTGKPVFGSLEELAERYPEFVDRQTSSTHALASVPIAIAGQILGGFVLFYAVRQRFSDSRVTELKRLGDRLGAELRSSQRARALPNRSLADEPVPSGAQVAVHVVAAAPSAVGLARQFVRDELVAWHVGGDAVEVAVLCVSELVTNAIIHTVAGCELRAMLQEGILTLSVRDCGTEPRVPAETTHDPLAVHGRGLQVVEMVCTRWGSELDADGMTVWCELDVT
jgi:anti-sigma regulatory factor (Ser/Thr protein kinase)